MTHKKKEGRRLNLACLDFLCITLPIDVFSVYPIHLKSPILLEKTQVLVSVLVSEQRTKQRQHNAQISHVSVQTYLCDLARKLISCFLPFLKIFKSDFLIQDLISRLIMNQNEISIYQNLSFSIDN